VISARAVTASYALGEASARWTTASSAPEANALAPVHATTSKPASRTSASRSKSSGNSVSPARRMPYGLSEATMATPPGARMRGLLQGASPVLGLHEVVPRSHAQCRVERSSGQHRQVARVGAVEAFDALSKRRRALSRERHGFPRQGDEGRPESPPPQLERVSAGAAATRCRHPDRSTDGRSRSCPLPVGGRILPARTACRK